jgi:YVTN family beta-propeller protein
MKNVSVIFVHLAIALVSCNRNDEKPKGEFSSGVFVVNEGNFGSSNGDISFYMPGTGVVKQNVFAATNGGKILGDVFQSMTISGDIAYLVINNNGRVETADANTLVSQHTITGLSLPRFFLVFGDKGYVTEWVSFTDPGRVSIIDLKTQVVEATIGSDYGAENIIAANNELFVSNNFSNTVFVMSPTKKAVVDTVIVGAAPGAFELDKDNKLWVICGGGYDSNFDPLNNGALYRIDIVTHAVDRTISLGQNVSAKLSVNKAKDKLYYFDNTQVYAVNISDTSAPTIPFITESTAIGFYGIGVDPANDIVYVGDAKGFTGSGTVFRYSPAGVKIDNFTSGIGPAGFVFK